jgi:NitT/TauT family transport system permease protein
MADSYRIDTRSKIRHIYIPYLFPALLAASRIGFSLSWKVAVLSEVFGLPDGIGFKIRILYLQYDLKSLLAYLAFFLFVVIVIEQVLRTIEKRATKWRG